MATNTPNYNLVKPSGAAPGSGGDLVDISVIDGDLDIIDTEIKNRQNETTALDTRLDALEAKYPFAEQEVHDNVSHGGFTTVESTILSLPAINFDGTTSVEASFSCYNTVVSSVSDTFFLRIYDGATMIAESLVAPGVTNGGNTPVRAIWTPTAGSRVVAVKTVRNSGTGSITVAAAPAGIGAQLSIRPLIKATP